MKNDLRAIIALIATYTVGNFLLLLNRGMYWDGWDLITLIQENKYGLLWKIYISDYKRYTEYFILRILGLTDNPLFFGKLLAFISFLLAGLFIYGILRKKLLLPINTAFFLSAYSVLVPSYLVRVEISMLHYTVNYMLFFGAVFLYFLTEKNKNLLVKSTGLIFSWIIFFLSFNTESLLVFYGGFLLILSLNHKKEQQNEPLLPSIISWLKKDILFIILPIIFWAIKLIIGKPIGGPESEYNQFLPLNYGSLTTYIQNTWQFIVYGFFWPLIAPLAILQRKIFTGIFLISLAVFYFINKKVLLQNEGRDFSYKYYFSFGLFLYILGIFPYLVVGKAPHTFGNGFGMRNTLLLPLGSSLIILSAILTAIKDKWQIFIKIIILTLFSTFSIYNYYWLDMDSYQQLAIIENLKETKYESIKNASALIFNDDGAKTKWLNRNIRNSEFFAYVQEAFPKENRKLASGKDSDPIETYPAAKLRIEFPPNFDPSRNIVDVDVISKANREITTVHNWLLIKKSEIFYDESVFLENIRNIYQIEVIPSLICQ